MFCPDCETEYREGFERCADCGSPLVEMLGTETGESQLVPLTEEDSPVLVGELVDRLEKAGVPYVIEAGTALALRQRIVEGEFEPDPWHAQIWVAAGKYEARARRIVDDVRARAGRS